jgi:hypothetical protein
MHELLPLETAGKKLIFGAKPGQVGEQLQASAAQWDLSIVAERSQSLPLTKSWLREFRFSEFRLRDTEL